MKIIFMMKVIMQVKMEVKITMKILIVVMIMLIKAKVAQLSMSSGRLPNHNFFTKS